MIDTSRTMLYYVNNLNTKNAQISYSMGSGKAIKDGSDDSTLFATLNNLEDKLRVTKDLDLQLVKSKAINDSADRSVADDKKILEDIKVDLLKSLNDGMDRDDKLALATNMRGMRENLIDQSNTEVDGEFVFSGSDTTTRAIIKDKDYKLNGKVTYEGNGFLRQIAVAPGSYRDRGITAYDVNFYTASKAGAGESFTFSAGERIIDENGNEWKLNDAKDKLQKYDHNGKLYDPAIELSIDSDTDEQEATDDSQAVQATYTIDALPDQPAGRVFEAKHNYFDDLNIVINALEGKVTQLDGTAGATVDDDVVDDTLRTGLDHTAKQYNATNIGHGELGGRNKVFDVAYEKNEAKITNYNILLQQYGGADLTKLSMDSKALEMTYSALYSTISKLNDLTLLKYLN